MESQIVLFSGDETVQEGFLCEVLQPETKSQTVLPTSGFERVLCEGERNSDFGVPNCVEDSQEADHVDVLCGIHVGDETFAELRRLKCVL